MANKRSISIANTGNVKISIILNYREVGGSTFDLLPGGPDRRLAQRIDLHRDQ